MKKGKVIDKLKNIDIMRIDFKVKEKMIEKIKIGKKVKVG